MKDQKIQIEHCEISNQQLESLARVLLPILTEYLKSEEAQLAFEEYLQKKE